VTISAASVSAREQARQVDGKFGAHRHAEQDADLAPAQDPIPPTPRHLVVYGTDQHGFDEAMTSDLFARAYREASDGPITGQTEKAWRNFCSWRAKHAHSPAIAGGYRRLAAQPPDDPRTLRAALDMNRRDDRASKALSAHVASIAAVHGVDPDRVRSYVRAARIQHQGAEPGTLPAPPAEWVAGVTERAYDVRSAPHDPATLYALYRAEADPEAFGRIADRPRQFASVDLETAGPFDKSGFKPENGCIIEVGVSIWNERGERVGEFASLVRPEPRAAGTYRTGAVDVHGIQWEDVENAPEWPAVATQLETHLRGSTMIAQNSPFESTWLDHHMPAAGASFDRYIPTADTFRVAQRHFGTLENHKLETIAGHVGVEYADGHRALHDADVAARTLFAMQGRIEQTYQSDPAWANAPKVDAEW